MDTFKNSKIYIIRSRQTSKFYIGSTTNSNLVKCLRLHKEGYTHYINKKPNYVYIPSFDVVKYDDCYIELLEDYCCFSRLQLNKRVFELIDKYNKVFIN
jgi:hypothetical protein